MRKNKYTYEEVKDILKSSGYRLIDKIYKSTTKITFCDKDGYIYFATFTAFIRNFVSLKFHMSNPYTIDNIRLWCKLNNKPFELVSEEYKNTADKLKWRCLKQSCGEIFESSWQYINSERNHGCNFCSGNKAGLSNCLATKRPDIASEWHPTKNGNITPYDVTYGSKKYIWWKCDNGHEWNSKVNTRVSGNTGCPFCKGNLPSEENNLFNNTNLCREWNYNKNKKTPLEYTSSSTLNVWWICEKGHEWQASPNNRKKGSECPYCVGSLPSKERNLFVDNPELCQEWDYDKNKTHPKEHMPKSGKKVWWKCLKCKCEWQSAISQRNNGQGCPTCSMSKGEKSIVDYLINYSIHYEPQKTFNGLFGLRGGNLSYDFFLPDYNLLIEYQGQFHDGGTKGDEYLRKNLKKQKEHDRRKQEYARQNGYNLLEIWYWDFENIEQILTCEIHKLRLDSPLNTESHTYISQNINNELIQ